MDKELTALAKRLDGHRVWKGFGGWFYVWRLRSSPQDLRRHETRGELLADLRHRVAEQDQWDAANL